MLATKRREVLPYVVRGSMAGGRFRNLLKIREGDVANTPQLNAMDFFDLGCQVTRHLHGITERAELTAMLQVVKDVADGHLTLVDSPEEIVAQLGPEEKALADNVPEVLRLMRTQEKAAAQQIWDRIIEISNGR